VIKSREGIPELPGVYLFKSRQGKILYIGKARNLRKRTNQYFQKKGNPFLDHLLGRADRIDYIVTDHETDALLLEYNLIQNYQPEFNIRLKDDKSFPFIEITIGDEYPGIYYSRKTDEKSFVLGPMAAPRRAKSAIDILTRIFRLRQCSQAIFKKGTPCLYYHIDRCSAPCAGKIVGDDYRVDARSAIDFLRGKKGEVIRMLQRRMRRFSDESRFEEAQKVKEDIDLLGSFVPESYISSGKKSDFDVIVPFSRAHESKLILFSVLGGKVCRSDYFSFDTISSAPDEILREFFLHFYRPHNLPAEITVPFPPADLSELEALFSRMIGRRVRIRIPKRGEKKKLLELAEENLARFTVGTDFERIGPSIQRQLALRNIPSRIEGYDVSHLAEKERVGALVVFDHGKPVRRLYRSFIIKTAGAGDTEALREILTRRFRRPGPAPDLLLIDGGKSQLGIALQVKRDLHLSADVVSLAKEEERIFTETGETVVFPKGSPERHLFQNIRDEAHRRAVTHHRKRREAIVAG
jgi:excinuclease ABC subunit C